MRETIRCPGCGRELQISVEHQGKYVRCPSCKESFQAGAPNYRPDADEGGRAAVRPSSDDPAPTGSPGGEETPPTRAKARASSPPLGFIIGIGLAVVGVTVALVVIASRRSGDNDKSKPLQAVAEKPDDNVATLKIVFDNLGTALRGGDRNVILQHFDTDRMLDELVALDVLADKTAATADFRLLMHQVFGRSIENWVARLAWDRTEIKKIVNPGRHEIVVIARHFNSQNGACLKMRWWLVPRDGTWKIFDMEIEMGGRLAMMLAVISKEGDDQRAAQLARVAGELGIAFDALAHDDVDHADRALGRIGDAKLPKIMEATRLFLVGLVQMHREQWHDSLASWNLAHAIHPDMPCLDLLKGIAWNGLRDGVKAFRHLSAYQDLMGDDALVCVSIGMALQNQGRFPEALVAHRKALDYDPHNFDALVGLVRSLALDDNCDDLRDRFSKLDRPQTRFAAIADECRKQHHGPATLAVSQAMLKLDPNHPTAPFCLAVGKAWTQKTDEAIADFKSALKKHGAAGADLYVKELLPIVAAAGKVMDIYADLPDKKTGFETLAFALKKDFLLDEGRKLNELRKLIKAHAAQFPDDPTLLLYQAGLLANDGQFERADKLFQTALAGHLPDPLTLELFRLDRIQARYHTGHAAEALADIGPKQQTLSDLANRCFEDRNYDLLQTLLEPFKDDLSLNVLELRVEMLVERHHFDEAVKLVKTTLDKLPAQEQRDLASSFLMRMSQAGKAFEGYQAVPDSKWALRCLASDPSLTHEVQDRKRIIEAYRKKHPDDVWLSYFTAQSCVREKAWDQAERILAESTARVANDLRPQFSRLHIEVLYQLNRHLQAYDEIGPRQQTLDQLAGLLIRDRKGEELEALLARHRLKEGESARLLFLETRAKIVLKKPDEAVALFQKLCLQSDKKDVQGYASTFLFEMERIGRGMDAYRAAPNAAIAFQTLASNFKFAKKDKELAELLAEHGKKQDVNNDVEYLAYSADLILMQGDAAKAEAAFREGLRTAPQNWRFQDGVKRAGIRAGNALKLYQEFGPTTSTFENLASMCVGDKNADQLEALMAAHQKENPDDAGLLRAWAFDLAYLRQDYEGALQILREQLNSTRYRWKFNSQLIRCLIKTKRTAEALEEADKRKQPVMAVLACAAGGDVQQTIAAIEKWLPLYPFLVEDCYFDADLGPMLRSDAFKMFRDKFPAP